MKRKKLQKSSLVLPKLAEHLTDVNINYELKEAILCALSDDEYNVVKELIPELVSGFDEHSSYMRLPYNWPMEKEQDPWYGYASFEELLSNVRDRAKGKLTRSKEILKDGYDYFSKEQQHAIIRVLLPFETVSDRRFVYEKLDSHWSDEFIEDIMAVFPSQDIFRTFGDRFCTGEISKEKLLSMLKMHSYPLFLMSKHFPEEYVIRHFDVLKANTISYFNVCKRFGKREWFTFDSANLGLDSITINRYLEAHNYAGCRIGEEEARRIFYKVIAITINEFLNPTNNSSDLLDKIYRIRNERPQIKPLFDIKVLLLRMGYIELVKELIQWQTNLVKKFNKYISKAENQTADFFRVYVENFPEEYKYLLADSEYDSKVYINHNGNILLSEFGAISNAKKVIYRASLERKSITAENLMALCGKENVTVERKIEEPSDPDALPFI